MQGMRKTPVEKENIILVMEFQPSVLIAFGVDPEDFLQQLSQMGLHIYEFSDGSGVEATTIKEVWAKGREMSGDMHIDLVLSGREFSLGV